MVEAPHPSPASGDRPFRGAVVLPRGLPAAAVVLRGVPGTSPAVLPLAARPLGGGPPTPSLPGPLRQRPSPYRPSAARRGAAPLGMGRRAGAFHLVLLSRSGPGARKERSSRERGSRKPPGGPERLRRGAMAGTARAPQPQRRQDPLYRLRRDEPRRRSPGKLAGRSRLREPLCGRRVPAVRALAGRRGSARSGARDAEKQLAAISQGPPLSHGPRMILAGIMVEGLKTAAAVGCDGKGAVAGMQARATGARRRDPPVPLQRRGRGCLLGAQRRGRRSGRRRRWHDRGRSRACD